MGDNMTLNDASFERTLLTRLAEQPVDDGELWCAYWGKSEGESEKNIPKNIDQIATDLRSDGNKNVQSRSILVHGRYGTGKSSFLKCLKDRLGEDDFIHLYLHMPVLTSNINSSALAAVITAMAQELKYGECCFEQGVEDLWRIEAGALRTECKEECDCLAPPEPNRMAGARDADAMRYYRANNLEKQIDDCLEKVGKAMVVYLDDLDRCARRVAMDVVRLLLRFGATKHIHFVLACDWDVLEQGVKDWMARHGKADDGEPLVSANSALEKYIHISVELPGMGQSIKADLREDETINLLKEILVKNEMMPPIVSSTKEILSKYGETPTLADLYVVWLLRGMLG